MKALPRVQKRLEQAIDGLSDAVGTASRIKELHQANGKVSQSGRIVGEVFQDSSDIIGKG